MSIEDAGIDYNISIHALREEGDLRQQRAGCCQRYFYPRPPRGGRHPKLGDNPQQ